MLVELLQDRTGLIQGAVLQDALDHAAAVRVCRQREHLAAIKGSGWRRRRCSVCGGRNNVWNNLKNAISPRLPPYPVRTLQTFATTISIRPLSKLFYRSQPPECFCIPSELILPFTTALTIHDSLTISRLPHPSRTPPPIPLLTLRSFLNSKHQSTIASSFPSHFPSIHDTHTFTTSHQSTTPIPSPLPINPRHPYLHHFPSIHDTHTFTTSHQSTTPIPSPLPINPRHPYLHHFPSIHDTHTFTTSHQSTTPIPSQLPINPRHPCLHHFPSIHDTHTFTTSHQSTTPIPSPLPINPRHPYLHHFPSIHDTHTFTTSHQSTTPIPSPLPINPRHPYLHHFPSIHDTHTFTTSHQSTTPIP